MRARRTRNLFAASATVAMLALTACGGGDDEQKSAKKSQRGQTFESVIDETRDVDLGAFPSARGKTLQELAGELPAVNLALATSIYTPGRNRLAFGILDQKKAFVYGPTALYYSSDPAAGQVRGPIAAPADPLLVKPAYRSQGAAQATDDIAAIYDARLNFPRAGRWYVLAVTRSQGKTIGAATQVDVKRSDPTPAPGQRAPVPKTDTLASAGGDIKSIDTRVPADDMHGKSLKEVAGKKPVALLFATPQLCQTRVCGPVVDIAAQMKAKYGDRMEFIHQEVYVDNSIKKGVRPPLAAYELATEPWLFTLDRDGRVAARLQGSFGTRGFEQAVKAAL